MGEDRGRDAFGPLGERRGYRAGIRSARIQGERGSPWRARPEFHIFAENVRAWCLYAAFAAGRQGLFSLVEHNGLFRDNGGNRVFINHLLLAVGGKKDHKCVKAGDPAPGAGSRSSGKGDVEAVLAGLGEKLVLRLLVFCIICTFLSSLMGTFRPMECTYSKPKSSIYAVEFCRAFAKFGILSQFIHRTALSRRNQVS